MKTEQVRSTKELQKGPPMEENNIHSRAATISDASGIAKLFQDAYGDSSHPCRKSDFVQATLNRPGEKWFVLEDESRILACTGYARSSWNQTYEICRSVTARESQRRGFGRKVYESSLVEMLGMGDADYLFGMPRSFGMYRIMSQGIEPPLVLVGHDGAMNRANGQREYHLLGVIRNPRSKVERVAPVIGQIAASAFVADKILKPLGSEGRTGPYPERSIVGEPAEHRLGTPGGCVDYCLSRDPGNAVAKITRVETESGGPREIHRALRSFLEHEDDLQHASVHVLADKEELIGLLVEEGWVITAYLPAWHLEGGKRYDCVLLVKQSFSDAPLAHDTRAIIEEFHTGLNNRRAGILS